MAIERNIRNLSRTFESGAVVWYFSRKAQSMNPFWVHSVKDKVEKHLCRVSYAYCCEVKYIAD